MLRYLFAYLLILGAWLLRKVVSHDGRSYMLLSAPFLQRRLEWIARMRCYAVFYKASKRCPAYSQFLDASGFDRTAKWKLEHLPVMTKENYVKTFSIEERCYEGRIP